MGSVLKYDRVVLVKEFGKMKMVGEVYEVANITETAFVLRDAKNKVAVGVIDIRDFEEYFKKEEEVKGWTPWTPVVSRVDNGTVEFFYRTNRKKVQVKLMMTNNDSIKGEASCNTMDEFDLYFGIKLAYTRLDNKFKERYKRHLEEELVRVITDIKQNEKYLKQMTDSLKSKLEK